MAKENVQKVVELINEKPELQERLAKATDAESYKSIGLEIAEESGFPITSEEFDEALSVLSEEESKELSPSELEAVAGGGYGPPISSITCSTYSGKKCDAHTKLRCS